MTLEEFLDEWNNDSERVLVHTSGSTGAPKPLWVEKRRMEASARITCDFLGLKEGDTALLCMPLDYIAGKMMVVRSLVRKLKLMVVEPTGHPLVAHQLPRVLTFAAMVPMQVYNSLQVPEERERLRQIRHLIIGGGAIDDALARELKDFPNYVWSTYGMTETLSHIALRRLNGAEASEWYTPFDNVRISQSEDGCLVIDAPEVCAERLVTNDIVEISQGRFRVVGRKDNVICSGGIKIQAEEVERALMPYLHVPFMITKRKDSKFGEIVVMMVECRGERREERGEWKEERGERIEESLKTRLQRLCREHLPKYWQPRDFVFVERIPMTETGKIARRQAEELASN
jgi:O-succinylbenzoic acid--CoA ligase